MKLINEEGKYNIINSDDIYYDKSKSIREKIQEQDEEIKRLKKYTKWYIKYGGMGSGSGSGNSTSTDKFNYKIEIYQNGEESTTATESSSAIYLGESGYYNIKFTVTNVKNHEFSITNITLGGESLTDQVISSGFYTVTLENNYISKKSILSYTITDETTGDYYEKRIVIYPEIFVPNYTLQNNTATLSKDGGVIKLSDISNIKATFKITINDKITIYYRIGYKLEDNTISYTYTKNYENKSEDSVSITDVITNIIESKSIVDTDAFKTMYIIFESSTDSAFTSPNSATYALTIVPNTLSVVLEDSNETKRFYTERKESNYIGIGQGTIPFSFYFYNDSTEYITFKITCSNVNDDDDAPQYATSELTIIPNTSYNVYNYLKTSLSNGGWYKLAFEYGINNTNTKTSFYFYVNPPTNDWTWDYNFEPNKVTYYSGYTDPFIDTPIYYRGQSETIELNNLANSSNKNVNFRISLGIQYDENNPSDSILFTLKDVNNNVYNAYQDCLKYIDDNIVDYFIPLEKDIDSSSANYHLITYDFTYVNSVDGVVSYEVTVFVDGILDGISSSLHTVPPRFNTLVLNPNHNTVFQMNLFGCVYCDNLAIFNGNNNISNLPDISVSNYYHHYKEKMGINLSDTTVDLNDNIKNYFKFNKYQYPYIENDTELNSLIFGGSKVSTPVLIIDTNISETQIETYFTDMFLAYIPEKTTDASILDSIDKTNVYYIGKTDEIERKNYTDYLVKNYTFNISVQGSSTRQYTTKNFNISVDNSNTDKKILFTPNFDKSDLKNSFLPEETFTLKCDFVDSSSCNNNSLGSFINENYPVVGKEGSTFANNEGISSGIKKCLIGFPILLFMKIGNYFYYFGIYNFNLSRDSKVNFGYYKDIDKIIGKLENKSNSIQIIEYGNDDFEYTDGLCVCEVSKNQVLFDFSQYKDLNLLFNTGNEDEAMFSDCIFKSDQEGKEFIRDKIEKIAKSGEYIFNTIGKSGYTYDSISTSTKSVYNLCNDSGVSYNYVTNCKQQWVRNDSTFTKSGSTENYDITDNTKTFEETICEYIFEEEGSITNEPVIDLETLVYYYVICMVFGMVDSVEKNLELKSWDSKRLYPSFYDMDTALGIDNGGNESVSYFAFSDYWDTQTTDDTIQNLTKANIYSDFFNKGKTSGGYDTPSNFLFAIAKYATIVHNTENGDMPTLEDGVDISPVNIYANFRKTNGKLQNSDYFFTNYFDRLKNIPISLINLNYRSKYAKINRYEIDSYKINRKEYTTSTSESAPNDTSMFHGNGIYKKKYWLDKRLHLLDAYFNLISDVKYPVQYINDYNSPVLTYIDKTISGSKIYYPNRTNNVTLSDDVVLVKDMFNGTRGALSIDNLLIKADKYTPIVVYIDANTQPNAYLIGSNGNEKTYSLTLHTNGVGNWHIYGSSQFTYISNIGVFGFSDYTYENDVLESFNLLEGGKECSNFTLKTKNISAITINSNLYSGSLNLDNDTSFNKLQTIDLNNSKISFSDNRDDLIITSITLNGIVSNEISLPILKNISKVDITNATISTFNIPMWSSSITINGDVSQNFQASSLTINNSNNLSNSVIVINDMDTLTSLTLTKINYITIKNCKNLQKISVSKELKSLTIENCSETSKTLQIGNSAGTINLQDCINLTSLTVKNTYGVEKIICNSDISLTSSSLTNCYGLKYLVNEEGKNFYVKGPSVFNNDINFTLTEDGTNPCKILFNNTDLSYTFNCVSKGNIVLNALNNLLNYNTNYNGVNYLSSVTKMDYFCYNQNIATAAFTEYICLSGFTNVISLDHAFYNCPITYIDSNTLSFGDNVQQFDFINVFYNNGTNKQCFKIESFNNIGHKIKTLELTKDGNNRGNNLYVCDENGEIDSLQLKDFLQYLSSVTIIQAFAYIKNKNVYVDNVFDNFSNLKRLHYFMETAKNVFNLNNIGLNRCENLERFHHCFDVFEHIDEPLDLYNLFNETQWEKITYLNTYYGDEKNSKPNFGVSKKITEENFKKLLSILSGKTSITNLFNNCTVFTDAENLDIILPSSSITDIFGLFANLKATNNGKEVPLNIENTFTNATKISTLCFAFLNTYIENIPSNLFHKRETKVITAEDGFYVKKINTTAITSNGSDTIYYQIENTAPSLKPTENGNLWKTSEQEPTYEKENCYYYIDEQNSGICKVFDSVQIIGKVEKYNTDISDMRSCFSGCTFKTPFYKNENKNFAYINTNDNQSIDDQHQIIYENKSCTDKSEYFVSYFEDDLKDISANTYNSLNNKLKNFTIKDNSNKDYLFVSPDIFYGCKSDCNLDSVFASGYNTSDPDTVNEKYLLQGCLPKHLIYYFNNDSTLKNFIKNLNILPYLETENNSVKYYSFVPSGFTNNLTNCDYVFNFHIRVPLEDNTKFYLFNKNAFNKPVTSLQYSLPIYVLYGNNNGIIGYTYTSSTYYYKDVSYNTSNTDNPFNTFLVYDENENNETYIEKLNIANGTDFNFNNLISGDLAYVLSGKITNKATNNMNLKLVKNVKGSDIYAAKDALIYGYHEGNSLFINGYLKLPPISNTAKRILVTPNLENNTTILIDNNTLDENTIVNFSNQYVDNGYYKINNN